MTESPEVKIMSDFINLHSKDRMFNCINHIDNNNTIITPIIVEDFKLSADSTDKGVHFGLIQSGMTNVHTTTKTKENLG